MKCSHVAFKQQVAELTGIICCMQVELNKVSKLHDDIASLSKEVAELRRKQQDNQIQVGPHQTRMFRIRQPLKKG